MAKLLKKSFIKRTFSFLLVSAVSAFAFTACSSGDGDKKTAGTTVTEDTAEQETGKEAETKDGNALKSINVGIASMPVNFNTLERSDDAILDIFFQPIVSYDDDGTFHPLLAKAVTTEDNQTYTVELEPDALWSDGEPVTADDVLFTVKNIVDADAVAVQTSKFYIFEGTDDGGHSTSGDGSVSGIQKVDDHTVTFKTKFPVNELVVYSILNVLRPLPEHVLKDVPVEQFPTNQLFQEPTVTDGPYKLVKYEQGQSLVVEANKTYCKGVPKIDQITFKIITSENISAQLESGEIDLNASTIAYDDYERVKGLSDITVTAPEQAFRARILFINTKTVPDNRVRQAISYAINRDVLVKSVLNGVGTVSQGPYLDNNVFYNDSISAPVYDTAKAQALLKEAGWDKIKKLRLVVGTRDSTAVRAAQVIANQLTEAGIQIEIQQFDHATSLSMARAGDFDLTIFGYGLSPVEPDVAFLFKSTGSFNLSQYNNSKVDELFNEGLAIVDTEERKKVYDQIQEQFAIDFPDPFLYGERNIYGVNNRLKIDHVNAFGFFNDVYNWDVTE